MNDDSSESKPSWLERLTGLWGESEKPDDCLSHIRHAVQTAQQHQQLSAYTITMIESLLEIHQTQVRDIMIPRGQMVVLQEDWSLTQILQVILEAGHSRYPVVDEDHEKVRGILLSKDLLPLLVDTDKKQQGFLHLVREVMIVPESKPLDVMLAEFRAKRAHMALVMDEYGTFSGLVTIEDVIEEIVGEIDDEHDTVEDAPIIALQDGSYQVRALTTIEAFNDYFHTALSDEVADTIGGYVLYSLERMPKIGDKLNIAGMDIIVSKANQRRVISLNIRPLT